MALTMPACVMFVLAVPGIGLGPVLDKVDSKILSADFWRYFVDEQLLGKNVESLF